MRRLALITVALAFLVAGSASASESTDGGAHAALKGYKYCGHSKLSFTEARVFGRHYGCLKSRRLFQAWRKKLAKADCNPDNNYCKVSHVKKFRCVYGGDDLTMRWRCTKGDKRVRAYWGG
jgi:hypothetical protein